GCDGSPMLWVKHNAVDVVEISLLQQRDAVADCVASGFRSCCASVLHLRVGHQSAEVLACAVSVQYLLVKHKVKAVNQSVVDVSLKARHVRQNLSAGNDVVCQGFDVHSIRFV